MAITIRQALDSDVAAAEACLSDGKRALAAMGIPQWQDEYPNRIDIEADRAQGASYVAVDDDGTVLGVMALSFDGEKTYDAIDGAWLTESTSLSLIHISNAETSIMSVERGTWKLVIIASTTWNVEPGMR